MSKAESSNSDQGKRSGGSSTNGNGSQPRRPVGSAPAAAPAVKPQAKPVSAPTDPAKKTTAPLPTRTVSAPPEEHQTDTSKSAHFVPTKTGPSLQPTGEPLSYKNAVKASTAVVSPKPEATPVTSPVPAPVPVVTPVAEAKAPEIAPTVSEPIPTAPLLETPIDPPTDEKRDIGNLLEDDKDSEQEQRAFKEKPRTSPRNGAFRGGDYNNSNSNNYNNKPRGGANAGYGGGYGGYQQQQTPAQAQAMAAQQAQQLAAMQQQYYMAAAQQQQPQYVWTAYGYVEYGVYLQQCQQWQQYQAAQYQQQVGQGQPMQQVQAQPAQIPQQQQAKPYTAPVTAQPAAAAPAAVPAAPVGSPAAPATKADVSPVPAPAVPVVSAPVAPAAAAPVVAAAVPAAAAAPAATAPVVPVAPTIPADFTIAPIASTGAAPVVITAPSAKPKFVIKPKGATEGMSLDAWKEKEGATKAKVEEVPEVKADAVPEVKEEIKEEVKTAPIPDIPVSIAPKAIPAPAPVVAAPPAAPVTPASVIPPAPGLTASEGVADSWEEEAVEKRRLVPGGKHGPSLKLNQGHTAKKYTKTELFALRMPEESVTKVMLMGPIVIDGAGGGAGAAPSRGGAGWKGGRVDRQPEPRVESPTPDGNGGGAGWSKEALPRRAPKPAPGPMPKKQVSDPLEKLSMDIIAILNKITPQTFDKLAQQILDTPLENTAMLDKLVELIFEKAVQEPNFAFLYAELCSMLKEKGNWVFFTVIRSLEADEYFWIRDFSFPEEGVSFFSHVDAINAIRSAEELVCKPLTASMNDDTIEHILCKNMLYKLGSTMTGQWILIPASFDEVSEDQRGNTMFTDAELARKEAVSEVSFRARLAHSCEREFNVSVKNDNIDRLAEELRVLATQRGAMEESVYLSKSEAIEEQRGILKRRMLGNIRFVGELYKKKLLNTDTMHDCIIELLGTPGQWKASYDDADLELLCRFLKTVGESLESKSRSKAKPELAAQFNAYFDRMLALTKDKAINSRLRFTIEEVIVLRNNHWQERRATEGPKKISEIHKDMAQEANKAPAPVTSGGGGGGKGAPRILSNDARGRGAPARGGRGDGRDRGDARDRDSRDTYGGGGGGGGYKGRNAPNPIPLQPAPKGKPAGSAASAAAAPAPVAAPKEVLSFEDDHIKNKIRSSLDEYLAGEAVSEIKAMLTEGSSALLGYLVQGVIDKYLNINNASKDKLLGLLEDGDLLKSFTDNKQVIEASLEHCEAFKALSSTAVDVLDAPQRIARVVSKLIQGGVIRADRIAAMAEAFRAYNVEQDFDSPDVIDACFQRFTAALVV